MGIRNGRTSSLKPPDSLANGYLNEKNHSNGTHHPQQGFQGPQHRPKKRNAQDEAINSQSKKKKKVVQEKRAFEIVLVPNMQLALDLGDGRGDEEVEVQGFEVVDDPGDEDYQDPDDVVDKVRDEDVETESEQRKGRRLESKKTAGSRRPRRPARPSIELPKYEPSAFQAIDIGKPESEAVAELNDEQVRRSP